MSQSLPNPGNVSTFRDKCNSICSGFEPLNPYEKLSVMNLLLSRVPHPEIHFLVHVLEMRIQTQTKTPATALLQKEANDAKYVDSLRTIADEYSIACLLSHFPLLRPGNTAVLEMYIVVLGGLFERTLIGGGKHRNDSFQLLSLAIIHPAMPTSQRNNYLCLYNTMTGKSVTPQVGLVPPLGPAGVGQGAASSNHHFMSNGTVGYGNQPQLTNSWHPSMEQQPHPNPIQQPHPNPIQQPPGQPSRGVSPMLGLPGADGRQPVRSSSMASGEMHHVADDGYDRGMIRSQSLPMTRRSDPGAADSTTEPRPGMKDVGTWLKSLRLHKYLHVFLDMGYDELLGLTKTSRQLEGVTEGARNKIILSVQKLNQRPENLQRMLRELDDPNKLKGIVTELRAITWTPICAFASHAASGHGSTPSPDMLPDVSASSLHTAGSVPGRQSPDVSILHSSPSEASASQGPAWSVVEGNDAGGADGVTGGGDGLSLGDVRCGAKVSASSHSSQGSTSSSSSSRHGSDVGPSPSPVNAAEDVDLPSLIVQVVVKACSVFVNAGVDEETGGVLLGILDRTICHEGIAGDDKKQLFLLKAACQLATREVQRRAMHDSRYSRNWHPANLTTAFHPHSGHSAHPPHQVPGLPTIPGHSLPIASPQALPRHLPPQAPLTMPPAAAAANQRRLERQNARNGTAAVHRSHRVPVAPGTVNLPRGPPPGPHSANPYGAPGSGRRPGPMPGSVLPMDSTGEQRHEMWSNFSGSMMNSEQDSGVPGAGSMPPLLPNTMPGQAANALPSSAAHTSQSANVQPGQLQNAMAIASNGVSPSDTFSSASETDKYMDDLCYSMTEHALNG